MAIFEVKITQVLRIEKSVVLQLEAHSRDEVADALDAGEYGLPAADDPAWVTEESRIEHEEAALL